MYENEESPVHGGNQPLSDIPEDRPMLSLSPHGQNPAGDFQFSLGLPSSGFSGRGLSVQNPLPSILNVAESSASGSRVNLVQPVVHHSMQGQGSQLPRNFSMPQAPIPPANFSAGTGGFGGPSMQGSVFHVTMKPREPLVFCGKTIDDVENWILTVSAYFQIVAALEEQNVGYALTFL